MPTYASIGLGAAFILFLLRLVQGLCLGGEYGGAITYVAEHVTDEKRGYYTGWLQTSPTLGSSSRWRRSWDPQLLGADAFNDWGWRLPFILSLFLVAVAIYIRLRSRKPRSSRRSRPGDRPRAQSVARGVPGPESPVRDHRHVVVLGEGCVWYSSQFWALYFLQTVKKLDVLTSSLIVGIGAAHRHPDARFLRLALRPGSAASRSSWPAWLLAAAHLLSAVRGARPGGGTGERQLPVAILIVASW